MTNDRFLPDDDDISLDGFLCPECARELDIEVLTLGAAITIAYLCSEHGLIALGDPFA